MSHDKQCEAMLMPPDANRAQLCHCRLREIAAERDALRAELDALRARVIDTLPDADRRVVGTLREK